HRGVYHAAHRPTTPTQNRIVEAHREDDHPHDDAQAEDGDPEQDPTERRNSQGDDEQHQQLVVARESVDDPDRKHRLVLPVFREMPMEPRVEMPMLHEAMPMLVDMENVEFPEEADHPDQEQHDR